MTDKEQQIEKLSKKLIEFIDRETIDKFIEDEEGNLKEIRTYSVYEIAKSLYNIGWRQVGDIEENFISKKALIACEDNKGATEHLLMAEKVIDEVRKETAKEIFNKLIKIAEDEFKGSLPFGVLKAWALEYCVEID